jgi:sugar-specific transcriptional regulator TrmB
MTEAVDLLQELGFSEYEARAYRALLQHNPVSGYELAKVSGIPRPNIYPVIQKLEERGAVVRLESSEETARYAPVPPEEFLERVGSRFRETLETTKQALRDLVQPAELAYVWNVQGYDNMLSHARSLIDKSRDQLLVAIWPDEAQILVDQMDKAEARGVDVTTLCMAACPEECGGCRGRVYRNKVVETEDTRWLMLIPDGEEALVGEIPTVGESSVVRTRQRLIVDLATWFIRHSIALAAVLLDAGERLETLLDTQTRATLDAIGPRDSGGWLLYMRRLLGWTAQAEDSDAVDPA